MTYIATINEENICVSVWSGIWKNLRELKKNEIFVNSNSVLGKKYENGKWVEVDQEATPEPTQLDRIEEAVNKSHEEIKNEAIDEYTSMLMEEGVI